MPDEGQPTTLINPNVLPLC